MKIKSSYILLIYCHDHVNIKTRAKIFTLDKGFYIYIGSCGINCSRILRHIGLRRKKRLFWHIDYLLERCSLRKLMIIPDIDEILLTKLLSEDKELFEEIPGFGSSDDHVNKTHLLKIKNSKIAVHIISEVLLKGSFRNVDIS
jgi:Uri superfamily endonuclease